MRTGRSLLASFCLGLSLSAMIVSAAQACSPVPPDPFLPGETQEAWQARQKAKLDAAIVEWQRDLWTRADRVYLARVSEPEPEPPPPLRRYKPRRGGPPPLIPPPPVIVAIDPFSGERPRVLTPSAALKGAAPARGLEVVDSWDNTSCGPHWRFNAGGSPPASSKGS